MKTIRSPKTTQGNRPRRNPSKRLPVKYPQLFNTFQQSYTTGKLPQAWTTALVTPIYKKGNKSNPVNYRPISLTCILCKVMEHIVLSHMWKHLNANDVTLHPQHGFQTGLSCQTELVEAVHDWASSMNNNKQTAKFSTQFPTNAFSTN